MRRQAGDKPGTLMMSLRALLVTPNQPPPEEPTTPEEWQLVVDAAAGFPCIAECRMYGVDKGGPELDVQNCAGLNSTCRTVRA